MFGSEKQLPNGLSPAVPTVQWTLLDPDDYGLPLAHYVWLLRRYAQWIALVVITSVLVALLVSLRLPRIYESTVVIDVDRNLPTGVVGEAATVVPAQDINQFLTTQVKLVQSDSVLRPVVQEFDLLRRPEEYGATDRETIQRILGSPIKLRQLKVKHPPNTFLIEISYRSTDPELAAQVANAIAQSYLQRTYEMRYRAAEGLARYMEKQIEELRAKMERSSNALAAYEKELGIIDSEQRTGMLAARLLELNTAYTRAQAERIQKEAAYEAIRQGGIDALASMLGGAPYQRLWETYNEARKRFAEIRAHFGPNHPEYKISESQLAELERQLEEARQQALHNAEVAYRQALEQERRLGETLRETKAEFDRLNARSFEYQTLKREAEGDKQLYDELMRRIKEATINASFQNAAVRIADPARPANRPVLPNIPLNVGLAFLISALVAVGVVLVWDRLDNSVRDPEQVMATLGVPVIGSLPEVRSWHSRLPVITATWAVSDNGNAEHAVRAYREAIRTLRNSVLLANLDSPLRTLLVTSPAPSEGKSTVAAYLALAHARHHRTLLVDADLRRPTLHKRFSLEPRGGLSDVLVDGKPWQQFVIHLEEEPKLGILPAGSGVPSDLTDLLGRELLRIGREAASSYELIIIDAPPLLGFAEPLLLAVNVDGVLVVARAGQTTLKSMVAVLRMLERLRVNLIGIALNETSERVSDSYRYYRYYQRYYRTSSEPKQLGPSQQAGSEIQEG